MSTLKIYNPTHGRRRSQFWKSSFLNTTRLEVSWEVLGAQLGCNKEDWVEETGKSKMVAVYDRVGNAGR